MRISDWSSDVCSSDLRLHEPASMSTLIGSLWWFVISLGLLVTFHEFGHYWVARRNGVKVLRFSVGFGRALWSRRGRDGTEYVIAAIPLGGSVKMLAEREADVDPAELDQAFHRKRSEEHTSELQSLMRIAYAVF